MSTDRESLWEPGKLWSLLDMLEVKAQPFIAAIGTLNQMTMLIDQSIESGRDGLDEIVTKAKRDLRRHLLDMATAANALSATNTAGEAEYIRRQLARGITWRDLQPLLRGVDRIFRREIETARLFAVESHKAGYYGLAAEVFGMEPVVAFPGAEYDLEEAGKCLAVGRSTAVVFHLMRAMELALQALCARIGIKDVEKRWGFLLADIDQAIAAMPKADRPQWSAARTNLWHVKEVWRNDTMHPNEKYTDAEAIEVLAAVKSFLRSLAPMAAKSA